MIQDSDHVAPSRPKRKWRKHTFTPEEEQQIRDSFHYDPESGILTWKKVHKYSNFKAGTPAGSLSRNKFGDERLTVTLNKRGLRVSRVAFFLMTGRHPSQYLDHINGDPLDNRWRNLREATPAENSRNKVGRKNTRAGLKGVTLLARTDLKRRFQANIFFEGKVRNLGHYLTALEAHCVYASAAFFAFGEFANIGDSPLLD